MVPPGAFGERVAWERLSPRPCARARARARPTLAGSLWPRRLRLSGRTLFRTRASAPAILTRPACRPQYMAKLAEQAERYEEMVEYMKKVAQGKQEEMLSLEVRRASRISSLLSPRCRLAFCSPLYQHLGRSATCSPSRTRMSSARGAAGLRAATRSRRLAVRSICAAAVGARRCASSRRSSPRSGGCECGCRAMRETPSSERARTIGVVEGVVGTHRADWHLQGQG